MRFGNPDKLKDPNKMQVLQYTIAFAICQELTSKSPH